MQTLKTAIVVVLLLTVTYSAYVALTAPTPELPAEVASLVEGHSLDLGDIGMGQIDTGTPSDFAADFNAGAADSPAIDSGFPDPAAGPGGFGSSYAANGSAKASLSDEYPSVPADDAAQESPASESAPADLAASDAPQSLPKPDPSTGSVSADPTQNYPSTAFGDFDLSLADGTLENDAEAPQIAASGSSTDDSANPNTGDAATTGDPATAGGSATTGDPATAGSAKGPHPGLVNAIATADRQWENDQLREALTTLSLFYNDPALQPADREPLQARLDMLAGEVIYSTRHLLEQPYRVREGDTLQTIAATYEVPWQLLANINQVQDPAAIVPGQELKIMRGPFRAEINLKRSELTLFLGELYAGRFPITVGNDPVPEPGSYTIEDKQTARTYYPLTGGNIPAGDPRNPYGNVWMDLGGQICIHGSPETSGDGAQGCIQLRTADADDVYGILSKGSTVSIMR